MFINLSVAQQIVFQETGTNLPIPSVNVYSSAGNLIGSSNKDGIVELMENKTISFPWKLTVQHVSYDTRTILFNKSNNRDTIFLEPRANMLAEVVIARSESSADVLRLKGYFRSLETFNLQHKYFADGIVEFFIPLKKGKVKYRLMEYRIYQDSIVTEDYTEKMWTFFQAARMVEIFNDKLIDRLKDYSLQKGVGNKINITKKGSEVGNIVSSDRKSTVSFYIDKVLPDSMINEKIFSIEAKTKRDVTIENYHLTSLEDIGPKNLLNIHQSTSATIKRKAEHGHIPYEILNEFYVLDQETLSFKDYKKIESGLIRSIYKTMDKSSYSHAFWDVLAKYNIPPVNPGLASQLGQNLQLVK